MAQKSRTWFINLYKRLYKPSEGNWRDHFDSFFNWVDDKIGVANIDTNLQDTINNKADKTYVDGKLFGLIERLEWVCNGTEGKTLQNDTLKIPKEQILMVSREGNSNYFTIDTGIPNDRQVLHDEVAGSIEFSIDIESGEQIFILIKNL